MPTKQEKRIMGVNKPSSKRTNSPVIGYKPINKEYTTEYSKREEREEVYSGLLWYNKESTSTKYPLMIRDNLAGILYLKLSTDETSKALKGFVGKAVHVLGKNVRLEDKVNSLLVKEVRQCNGKCNVFKF